MAKIVSYNPQTPRWGLLGGLSPPPGDLGRYKCMSCCLSLLTWITGFSYS